MILAYLISGLILLIIYSINTLSSTSSLSSHQKHCQGGRMNAKFKFSSFSTIYPDDSPLLLDQVDDDLPSLPSVSPHSSQNGCRKIESRREQRKQQRKAKRHAKFSHQISSADEYLIDDETERGRKGIELKSSLPILPMNCTFREHAVADFCAPTPTLEQLKVICFDL